MSDTGRTHGNFGKRRTPEENEAMSATVAATWQDPEIARRRVEGIRKAWADQNLRAQMIQGRKESLRRSAARQVVAESGAAITRKNVDRVLEYFDDGRSKSFILAALKAGGA